MSEFTKDEILLRACKILVQNFANQVEERREVVHTRIFSYFLHPEINYVHYGQSSSVTSHTKNHTEHAVPCSVLINECFRLIKENKLTYDQISHLLKKHWKIVTITKKESRKLDYYLGYKSTMPTNWSFEYGDTFKRFNIANIKLISEVSKLKL
ncbi:hypothetical protein [Desulfohalobium retbaense]|uniref:Uncharacterized protein n=1 Tax=Desulfohalobium retbaense (strain ATCC 49708 / DSM 5692 / JCM 16813 / HR100) TaxID=485915 RepID=C8X5W1_DESRD|nr:hypothetical protein [Desulfohalobium retbaense]ACV69808.1 hypothetical protein Dret_2530 [Desulfohalobium retbaense DSM 5692]